MAFHNNGIPVALKSRDRLPGPRVRNLLSDAKKKHFYLTFGLSLNCIMRKPSLLKIKKKKTNNFVLFWNTWPDVFALFMGVLTVPTLTSCFTSRNSSTRLCKLFFVFGTPDNRISTISLHINVFHDTPVLLFSQIRLVCIYFFLRTLSHTTYFS